jgi:hypothetical protein
MVAIGECFLKEAPPKRDIDTEEIPRLRLGMTKGFESASSVIPSEARNPFRMALKAGISPTGSKT